MVDSFTANHEQEKALPQKPFMREAHTAAMNMVADARLSAIGYRLFSHQSPGQAEHPARTRAGEVDDGR